MDKVQYQTDYYQKNKAAYVAHARNWALNNPTKRKEIVRTYRRKLREAVLEVLGGKCVRCGFSDHRALQVDHVNSDGFSDTRCRKDRYTFYKHIVQEGHASGRYQLLCANCNWIKVRELEEYPRRRSAPEGRQCS
jgi:hypothetical protein